MHKISLAVLVGLLNLMLLVPQSITAHFMEAGNDNLSTL